jgi:hypothetical protein
LSGCEKVNPESIILRSVQMEAGSIMEANQPVKKDVWITVI